MDSLFAELLLKLVAIISFGFFVFQLWFTEGILRSTSGSAAFLMCLLLVAVLLLNRIGGFESVMPGVVAGIVCSLSGIVLIVSGTGRGFSLASEHPLGAVVMLASQFAYAYYAVFSR